MALLGSSTLKHLVPGIRVAGLRRGLWIEVYEAEYGQYLQELMDSGSALHAFHPEFICFAMDAHHLANASGTAAQVALDLLRKCWHLATSTFKCTVIQQTLLPIFPDLLGSNEHRMSDSPQAFVQVLNSMLGAASDDAGVHLLAIDKYAARDGLRQWHNPALWYRSKQEVHPAVSHLYGEYAVRLIAAQRGRSSKCLVLDLDNTLWGGVIGDDGLQGIVLGPGSAEGEAYVAFQRYALRLKARGVILAVCSKNDIANALAPFAQHPEMALQQQDIACFVANWQDKAANLQQIAATLNIGIDSLVFADDNPFERNLVRQELPEVAVPELPEDPALYAACIADAGYFESVGLSPEDRERANQYRANAERELLRESSTDMQGYLKSLAMEIHWKPFDEIGLQRIVQLINKTNQFNLTTRRYSEGEVRALMNDPRVLTWQVRLKDRMGDNGIIAVMIAKMNAKNELEMDTWLMSCRVLGRQVENACLNLVCERGKRMTATHVVGEYRPTAKNGMVRDFYSRMGFQSARQDEVSSDVSEPEGKFWVLDLKLFTPQPCVITVFEEMHDGR